MSENKKADREDRPLEYALGGHDLKGLFGERLLESTGILHTLSSDLLGIQAILPDLSTILKTDTTVLTELPELMPKDAFSQLFQHPLPGFETINSVPSQNIGSLSFPSVDFIAWFKDIQREFRRIAHHGWFADPTMPLRLLRQLAELANSDPDAFQEKIGSWFRERILAIETKLIEVYPNRAHIISDAFWAHREEKFTLSVPCLLSQADGIWHETFHKSVFKDAHRKKVYHKYNIQDSDGVKAIVLSLLEDNVDIWQSNRKKAKSENDLNRHLVVHGVEVGYASEEHSLKAISFLWWVSWVLEEHRMDEDSHVPSAPN